MHYCTHLNSFSKYQSPKTRWRWRAFKYYITQKCWLFCICSQVHCLAFKCQTVDLSFRKKNNNFCYLRPQELHQAHFWQQCGYYHLYNTQHPSMWCFWSESLCWWSCRVWCGKCTLEDQLKQHRHFAHKLLYHYCHHGSDISCIFHAAGRSQLSMLLYLFLLFDDGLGKLK
jgi:hypothetical protein